MVGFCDLVGTDIAPVSKKTAVKDDPILVQSQPKENKNSQFV